MFEIKTILLLGSAALSYFLYNKNQDEIKKVKLQAESDADYYQQQIDDINQHNEIVDLVKPIAGFVAFSNLRSTHLYNYATALKLSNTSNTNVTVTIQSIQSIINGLKQTHDIDRQLPKSFVINRQEQKWFIIQNMAGKDPFIASGSIQEAIKRTPDNTNPDNYINVGGDCTMIVNYTVSSSDVNGGLADEAPTTEVKSIFKDFNMADIYHKGNMQYYMSYDNGILNLSDN